MKLSELISVLLKQKNLYGDVQVYEEEDDGRVARSIPLEWTGIEKRQIWKGHPDPPRWYLK